MNNGGITRTIKYEGELDHMFADKIASVPGNERLYNCIQCGTCSGTCPLSIYMDYTPRRIIAMTRAGFRDEVLRSFTIWLCASCYSCTAECPKEIRITDIMYALKRCAIQEGVHRRRFPIPILAREFFRLVFRQGRNSEGRLLLRLYLKSNPFLMLKNAILGLRLFGKGRISMRRESIENRQQLKVLLDAVNESDFRESFTAGRQT